jgi:hypothetical protein
MSLSASRPGLEHRRAPRQEVAVRGLLVHGRPLQAIACTIRDVSATGARVKLKASEFLSRPVYMVIAKTGAAFQAEIAWSRDGELGLAFKGRLDLAAPKTELEVAMARLWKAAAR